MEQEINSVVIPLHFLYRIKCCHDRKGCFKYKMKVLLQFYCNGKRFDFNLKIIIAVLK